VTAKVAVETAHREAILPLVLAGAGTAFLPDDDAAESVARAAVEALAAEEGLRVLGWRDVPTAPSLLGRTARGVMPRFRQLVDESRSYLFGKMNYTLKILS